MNLPDNQITSECRRFLVFETGRYSKEGENEMQYMDNRVHHFDDYEWCL